MPLKFDLRKAGEKLKLSLEKAGVNMGKMDVAIVMDCSSSFEDEHRSGVTSDLMTRFIPWGLTFDQNGEIDVYTFSNGAHNVCHVGTLNEYNYPNFVPREIVDKVQGWSGGTDYSYVIQKVLEDFGWAGSRQAKRRTMVIFITDGECSESDIPCTRRVLEASQNRSDKVYFLFVGVSSRSDNFPFLQDIAERYTNTGLIVIPKSRLHEFVRQTDEQLNAQLLGQELITWLKEG